MSECLTAEEIRTITNAGWDVWRDVKDILAAWPERDEATAQHWYNAPDRRAREAAEIPELRAALRRDMDVVESLRFGLFLHALEPASAAATPAGVEMPDATFTVRARFTTAHQAACHAGHLCLQVMDGLPEEGDARWWLMNALCRRFREAVDVVAIEGGLIAEFKAVLAAAGAPASSSGRLTKSRRQQAREHEGAAILLVKEQPELSNAEIARRVGCSRSFLTKCVSYRAVAATARDCRTPNRGRET